MTRIIPKRDKQENEPDQSTKMHASEEKYGESKNTSGWSLDEVFNAKDITPSKKWEWRGDSFTNEKGE